MGERERVGGREGDNIYWRETLNLSNHDFFQLGHYSIFGTISHLKLGGCFYLGHVYGIWYYFIVLLHVYIYIHLHY